MKILFFIIVFSIFLKNYSYAQELDSVIESKLDTIVIEAVRSGLMAIEAPLSVELIYAEKTGHDEPGRSLDELLNIIPGVFVSNRFNPSLGDRINIRGVGSRASFGVRGIKLILDNIPLTMPDGQSQLNNLDFGSIGTIEIIKGPSSSLYGNASGGVINIITENAGSISDENENLALTLQPRFLYGTYGFRKLEGKLIGIINKYSYVVNVSGLNSDGYRNHSAVSSFLINSVMKYSFSSSFKLNWVLNYYNSPYQLNPGSLIKNDAVNSPAMARDIIIQQGAGEQITHMQTGFSASLFFNPNSKLESSIYFISRDILNPIPGRIIDLNRLAGGIRTAYNHKFIFENFLMNFTAGIDFEFQNDERTEFVNLGLPAEYIDTDDYAKIFDSIQYGDTLLAQDENVTGIGPFIQTELGFSSFNFLIGLRYDNYKFKAEDNFFSDSSDDSGSRVMDKLSPSAGINFKFNDLSKIFLNYSTSFQTPTTSELSNRPDGKGGFNPDLLPEEIFSFEAGYLSYGFFNLMNLNIAAFYMNFSNMLIPYQVQGSEEIFFSNAGEAENFGLEFSIEFSPLQNLSTVITYSGNNFEFKDYLAEIDQNQFIQLAGKSVPGIPLNKISCEINYQNPTGLFASVKLIWVDEYFTNDFNGPEPGVILPLSDFINDSYTNIDIRLGYLLNFGFTDMEIFTGINNILDMRYNGSVVPNAVAQRFFEPAPDRNWYAGVRLYFPGSAK